MKSKKKQAYNTLKPGIANNTILANEDLFGWKWSKCKDRHCGEWKAKIQAIPKQDRPKEKKDGGWERKCFDFLEPFQLAGCIGNLRAEETVGAGNAMVTIMFDFQFSRETGNSKPNCLGLCMAKTGDDANLAYEVALLQLQEREKEWEAAQVPKVRVLPVIFMSGERRAIKAPGDYQLEEIHERALVIWENDIEFYVSQAVVVGWKKAWENFVNEMLCLGEYDGGQRRHIKTNGEIWFEGYPTAKRTERVIFRYSKEGEVLVIEFMEDRTRYTVTLNRQHNDKYAGVVNANGTMKGNSWEAKANCEVFNGKTEQLFLGEWVESGEKSVWTLRLNKDELFRDLKTK